AKDKATSKSQHITIKDSSALSKEEIEKMKKEAELHATEDRQKKELIDLRNQADALIHTTEKTLKDAGDKVKDDVKKPIEEKIAEVKKAKDGSDAAALRKAVDALGEAIQKVGGDLYKAAADAEKEKSAGAGSAGDDKKDAKSGDVIDADFKEKK
ncbi:Hsp70 family protein, partial [Candidatus Uhrbacteria bacterium]|nr:Hsp70 family protein [Candidatus Uhrbacteria bacterium]